MFPSRLKKLRTEKHMSQADLAKAFKVSQQTIGSWEVGRSEPNTEILTDIANYFSVSTDYLLGNTSKKNKSAPERATNKDVHDLKTFLDDNEERMTYEGEHLTDDEREQLRVAEETIFWKHRK